jgi:hypothetical protein
MKVDSLPSEVAALLLDYTGSTGTNNPFECYVRNGVGHNFKYIQQLCKHRTIVLNGDFCPRLKNNRITNLTIIWSPNELHIPTIHDITMMGWPSKLTELTLVGVISVDDVRELVLHIPTLRKLRVDDVNSKSAPIRLKQVVFPLNSQFSVLEFVNRTPKSDIYELLHAMLRSSTLLTKIQFITEDGTPYLNGGFSGEIFFDSRRIRRYLKGHNPSIFHLLDASNISDFTYKGCRIAVKNINRILAEGHTTELKICGELFDDVSAWKGMHSVQSLTLNLCNSEEGVSYMDGDTDGESDSGIETDTGSDYRANTYIEEEEYKCGYEEKARMCDTLTTLRIDFYDYSENSSCMSYLRCLMANFVANLPMLHTLIINGDATDVNYDTLNGKVTKRRKKSLLPYESIFIYLMNCNTLSNVTVDHPLERDIDSDTITRIVAIHKCV